MTAEEYGELLLTAVAGIRDTGFHWFDYHFFNGPTPFADSIIEACGSIDDRAPGIGTELIKELASIGGRERDERQYEQLLQKLSEILVIERIVNSPWPAGTTFQHEPAAFPNGPRPELLVSFPGGRLVVEVKTPSLLDHIRKRHTNPGQLTHRGGVDFEFAKELTKGELTLPRDNPVLDFLRDAERKFSGFREDPDTTSLLVIVWDDFMYEPISSLVNQGSGLLTERTYARGADGNPELFNNVDLVIAVRHLDFFIRGSREQALLGRSSAMDFGNEGSHPNVLFPGQGGRPIPGFVVERLRATRHDDEGLKVFADYQPLDFVFWLKRGQVDSD